MPLTRDPADLTNPQRDDLRQLAYDRAEWAADMAEYEGSTSIADIIAQLRRRARKSAKSARIVLGFLLLTVIAGLFFYLALPYIKTYFDGRRLTLQETQTALTASSETLDNDRETLKKALIAVLRNTNEFLIGEWSERVVFRNTAAAGDGALLVLGTVGTLVRYDIATGQAKALTGDWSESAMFRNTAAAGDGALLVLGNEGTLLRYDIATGQAKALTGEWSENAVFRNTAAAGDGALLVVGSRGALLVYPRPLSRLAEKADLSTDANLSNHIAGLGERVRALPEVIAVRDGLADIIGQRRPIDKQLLQVQADIDGLWTGLLPLAQQRENFADFMFVCRGPAATSPDDTTVPDPVTLACTQAWQADLARESSNWWQTIAEQVPPGVLLLFLLATLGGLYRYNLRLAGFHASRADLLELLMLGKGKDAVRFGKEDLAMLVQLSDALGADKVEFANAKTPTDQAVELARAISQR